MATVECPSCRTSNPSAALYCSTCGAPTHQSDGDELIGTTVGGRYHLVEKIGQGSAGTLYRAEHVTLRRRMAVKLLHKQLALSDEAIERFRREAITVCEIDNDHIPQVHDFGRTEDDRLFFAMEYLDGETLSAVLEREGRLSPERAADILTQIADGLMEAHTLGYVHRDLRPRSIFLTRRRGRQDFVKILDFGLAKLVQPEIDAQRTTMGMTYGDPRYMAPEQARGETADRRADIYSLGVLGFEMLVGEPPFKGGGTFEVLQKVLDAPVPRVRERRPDCPPWLESIVRTALAKRPADRFQTVAQLLDALGRKQVLANQPPMPMQLTNQQASKLAGTKEGAGQPGRANPFMQVFVSSPSLRPIPVLDEGAPPQNPTQVMPTVAPGNRATAPGAAAAKPATPAAPAAPPVAPRTTLSYPSVKPARSGTAPGMHDIKAGSGSDTATAGGDAKGSISGELQLLGSRLPPVEPKSIPPARAAEPAAKPSVVVAPTTVQRSDPTPRTARALLEQEALAWEEAALPALHTTDLTDAASPSEPTGRAPSADTPVEEMRFGAGAASAVSPPPAVGGVAPRPISAPAIAAMRSLHPGPSGPKASEQTKAVPAPAPASSSAPTRAAAGPAKAQPAGAESGTGAGSRAADESAASKTSNRIAAEKSAPSPSRPGDSRADAAAARPAVSQSKPGEIRTDAGSTLAKSAPSAAKTSDSRADAAAAKPAPSPSQPGRSRVESAGRTTSADRSPEGRETIPFERVTAPIAATASAAKPGEPAAKPATEAAAADRAAEPMGSLGLGLLDGNEGVEGADTGDATIPQIRVTGRDDETPIIGHSAESARSPAAASAIAAASGTEEPEHAVERTHPDQPAQIGPPPDGLAHDTPPDARPRATGAESNWFSTPAASAAEGFAADDGDLSVSRRRLPKWAVPAAAAGLVLLVIIYAASRPSPPRPSPTVPATGAPETPAVGSTPPGATAAAPSPEVSPPPAPTTPQPATGETPKPDVPAAKAGPEVTPLPVATALPGASPPADTTAAAKEAEPGPETRPVPDKTAGAPEPARPEKPIAATRAPGEAAEREPRPGPAAAKTKATGDRRPAAEGKTGEGKGKAALPAKQTEPERKDAAAKSAATSAGDKGDAGPPAKGEKKPGDAAALVQSGRKKLDDGEPDAAAALFARAAELDPRNAEAIGGLGESSFEQGNFDAAARHLSKAAKLAPRRTSYQELLVQALYKVGRFKDCVEACRKLLKQAPNSAKAKQTLELAEKKLAPAE